MMKKRFIRLDKTTSTNDYIKTLPDKRDEEMTVVSAEYQSAGKGQGTNVWESEEGKNLLFSFAFRPHNTAPDKQFLLSMACALAVKKALDGRTDGITLKWPNDVYRHNKKISGTLIETTVGGRQLKRCIFGIGINVNQETFYGDAPNPVSLFNITRQKEDPQRLMNDVLNAFETYYDSLQHGGEREIIDLYHTALYRRKGIFEYRDEKGAFEAEIKGVEPDGHLVLRDTLGTIRLYAFKEIKFII